MSSEQSVRRRSNSTPRLTLRQYTPKLSQLGTPSLASHSSSESSPTLSPVPRTPTRQTRALHPIKHLLRRSNSFFLYSVFIWSRGHVIALVFLLWLFTWGSVYRASYSTKHVQLHDSKSSLHYLSARKPTLPVSRIHTKKPSPTKRTLNPTTYLPHSSHFAPSVNISIDELPQENPYTSITILLPCPSDDMAVSLPNILHILNSSPSNSHPCILICNRTQSRTVFRVLDGHDHQNVFIRISEFDDPDLALVHAAEQMDTEWVLFLDAESIYTLSTQLFTLLYHPLKSLEVPYGPHGVVVSPYKTSCVQSIPPDHPTAPMTPIPAAFLAPPFTIRTQLLRSVEDGLTGLAGLGVWASLGRRIAQTNIGRGMGGLAVGSSLENDKWCNRALAQAQTPDALVAMHHTLDTTVPAIPNLLGTFVVLLPSYKSLEAFCLTLCRLAEHGHTLRILIYDEPNAHSPQSYQGRRCHFHYHYLAPEGGYHHSRIGKPVTIEEWLHSYVIVEEASVVLLVERDSRRSKRGLEASLENAGMAHIPSVKLPGSDLAHMEWAGTLSVLEWQKWHIPQVELVIITNDRPSSLARLLSSIQSAPFFGDTLDLVINLEQTADLQTLSVAQEAASAWIARGGRAHLRHRVILGGLMPAVVESWYPLGNDSYGLLLEDDIEVSPMFYAWAKWTILKYRYGEEAQYTSNLFGISLYQQKNNELHLEGRRPFTAPDLFAAASHLYSSSSAEPSFLFNAPYASQIPCSWGAIYFPEHWREFHDYLILRLSSPSFPYPPLWTDNVTADSIADDPTLPDPTHIVPFIRSNKWTHSWKKYFIEMVYLRGYTMLYPNYESFMSLSTNHLEVGAHVRGDLKEEERRKRKAQFLLPLMPLSNVSYPSDSSFNHHDNDGDGDDYDDEMPSLLDMPSGRLPTWSELNFVDLWGRLSYESELVHVGRARHEVVSGCEPLPLVEESRLGSDYDARKLLCSRYGNSSHLGG